MAGKANKARQANKTNKARFMDGFNLMCNTRNPYQVWRDCMDLFAYSIINPLTKQSYYDAFGGENADAETKENNPFYKCWVHRETNYLNIIKGYNEKEQELFPQMLGLLMLEAAERPNQDLLGQIYMELGISNPHTGQFFTPYSICQLMADITLDHETIRRAVKEKGYLCINDCAVGGGATIIAAINKCAIEFKRLDWRNHVYAVMTDIDITCCHMAYLQMCFLGVPGYVTRNDTIAKPEIDYRKEPDNVYWTPLWLSQVWNMRRFFHGLDMMMRKDPSNILFSGTEN